MATLKEKLNYFLRENLNRKTFYNKHSKIPRRKELK